MKHLVGIVVLLLVTGCQTQPRVTIYDHITIRDGRNAWSSQVFHNRLIEILKQHQQALKALDYVTVQDSLGGTADQ